MFFSMAVKDNASPQLFVLQKYKMYADLQIFLMVGAVNGFPCITKAEGLVPFFSCWHKPTPPHRFNQNNHSVLYRLRI